MKRLGLIAAGLTVAISGLSLTPALAADNDPIVSLCVRPVIHKAIDLPFPLPNLFNDPIPEHTLSLEFGGHNPDCK